jgi:hypothetical protein
MAQKRMFSNKITSTDFFLEMPLTSQALYFHLNMDADDDGFVGSPKKIMRMLGSTKNDFDLLLAKNFIIEFDSGICVITHWLIHNTLRKERYHPTVYTNEYKSLSISENKSYNGNQMATVGCHSIDKIRLDKISIDKGTSGDAKTNKNTSKFLDNNIKKEKLLDCVYLTSEEKEKLVERFTLEGFKERVKKLNNYIMSKGKKYKSHYHTILMWETRDAKTN